MMLITKEIMAKLESNGRKQEKVRGTKEETDFKPVVKIFMPDGGATWLLSEVNPHDSDIAFGLCDLGMGFPELGCVRLSEIKSIRGATGRSVERDGHFKAKKTLLEYAADARKHGCIIS